MPKKRDTRTATLLAVLAVLALLGCVVGQKPEHPASPSAASARTFLSGLLRVWPEAGSAMALAVTHERSVRVSSYDNALLILYLLRTERRAEAERILRALAKLQRADGSIPFSFAWPAPDAEAPYIRTGAAAWVGYAATEYLDAERGGSERETAARLAHGIATYLLNQQIEDTADARNGLVLGGEGTFRPEARAHEVQETYVPGPVQWASTEHNIDAFFFLRDFGRLTGDARYSLAAERILRALTARAWMPAAGQLARGIARGSVDAAFALDCASWGALFLLAAHDTLRAETAFAVADARYGAADAESGASGHRPYAHAPLIENRALSALYQSRLPARNWDELSAVWPEGSAGVALAALRLGRRERAEQILAELERLRDRRGGLPDFTMPLPFEFEARPSLAGTVWVELVRYELTRAGGKPSLWKPD